MEFLIILVVIVMYILFWKNWPLHLLLVTLMYAFYLFLWFTILFPKEDSYPGYAFYYLNIITMQFMVFITALYYFLPALLSINSYLKLIV